MPILYFENQSTRRLIPLGIHENTTYFYTDSNQFYEFLAFDIRFPHKWRLVGRFERQDISYGFSSLSPGARYIYVLFLRMTDEVTFGIQRIDLVERKEDEFRYTGDISEALRINFERVTMRSGPNGKLVLFDRSLVQGEIPLWTIQLSEEASKTFTVSYNPIGVKGKNTARNGCLFTVAVDPVNRCFAKLMSPRKMLVYTESRMWQEYEIPPEESLHDIFGSDGFPIEENRAVHETFGRHGHRAGAMQTRLTFHDLNGTVVARMLHMDRKNTTAVVELDHRHREIRVRKLATFLLNDSVSRMFYLIASPDVHVFLGVRHSAVVYIKIPSLEEIVGWRMQKKLQRDGYSDEVSQISNFTDLMKLSFDKYAVKTEETKMVTENMEQLEIQDSRELESMEMDFELD